MMKLFSNIFLRSIGIDYNLSRETGSVQPVESHHGINTVHSIGFFLSQLERIREGKWEERGEEERRNTRINTVRVLNHNIYSTL